MEPVTPHEKECALAAIAARLEKATTRAEAREWRKLYREWCNAPVIIEGHK